MKKYFLALTCCFTLLGASAQDKGAIDKALRDPQRKTGSAKADVYVQDRRRISDTPPPATANKKAQKARKRGACSAAFSKKKDPAR